MFSTRHLAALIAASLLALAIACGGGDDDDSSSSGSTPTGADQPQATATRASTSSATPTGSGAGGGGLATAGSNFTNANSYKIQVKVEQGTTVVQELNAEYVKPDRFRATITQSGGNVEIISIGTTSYLKAGSAPWQSVPASANPVAQFINPTTVTNLANSFSASGAASGGSATVNGINCQIFTYSAGGASYEACVANNLPIRVITTVGGLKTTMIFSDFNSNITINAPI